MRITDRNNRYKIVPKAPDPKIKEQIVLPRGSGLLMFFTPKITKNTITWTKYNRYEIIPPSKSLLRANVGCRMIFPGVCRGECERNKTCTLVEELIGIRAKGKILVIGRPPFEREVEVPGDIVEYVSHRYCGCNGQQTIPREVLKGLS